MVAALNAQDRVHRGALSPITTAVYSSHYMPKTTSYLGVNKDSSCSPTNVRTILNHYSK
jgi:hypothetical protein